MIWPFKRKPKVTPPVPFLGPKDCWSAGDMAECVLSDWDRPEPTDPRVGQRALVLKAFRGTHTMPNGFAYEGVGLRLAGFPSSYDARAFRKMLPEQLAEDRKVGKSLGKPKARV